MTIDEAIKILDYLLLIGSHMPNPDHRNAIKLGIEALKRHKTLKQHPYFKGLQLLPGETEK